MKDPLAIGGHRWIYENLIERLATADIATSAEHLGLAANDLGEVVVPFLGKIYLVSNKGVRRSGGKGFKDATGSVLIHYILKGSGCRPGREICNFCGTCGAFVQTWQLFQ